LYGSADNLWDVVFARVRPCDFAIALTVKPLPQTGYGCTMDWMVVFLFVDGLGLSLDPRSPLQRLELPTLRSMGGFGLKPSRGPSWSYRVLDATLGLEGLPQSGTGQTSLLIGENAAQLLGQHQGPFPATLLRQRLEHDSLPVWARQRGLRVLHANGYRAEYLQQALASRRNAFSSFAFAARAAQIPLLLLDHPLAVAPAFWEQPLLAGQQLAQRAQHHDLVILEHWALDWSAHRQPEALNQQLIELDQFVNGMVTYHPGLTVVITSDHGNAEESWHTQHTRNPVPAWVTGPAAHQVPNWNSLTQVAPWLRQQLSDRENKLPG
jgi:2,3-bisphosphoglycerate-independent phosphoglycerate mutase